MLRFCARSISCSTRCSCWRSVRSLGRVLLFVVLRDACHGLLVALRDRLVQALRARHERGPFGGRRGPRLASQRLFTAQALRLARELREAGVRLLHVELVLVALPRGGNGRLELRPERAHRGIVFRGAERFPFAGRLFDPFERVLAANALDLLDHRGPARVQRGSPVVFGAALRFHALVLRDAAARPARGRFESRHAVRFELERRFGRQRRPLALGALQFLRGALGGRRNRFNASHQARHLLLPRFECDPPCGLAPRPVLASLPAPSLTPTCSSPVPPPDRAFREARAASFDSTARSSAATPASL